MKVRCPKCQAIAKIDSHKVPEAGAYANCPHCQARFFVRKPDAATPRKPTRPSSLAPSQRPPEPEPLIEPPAAGRPEAHDDDLEWLDPYSVGTMEDDFKTGWVILIGLVALVLGILAFMSLHHSAPDLVAKPETMTEIPESGYDHRVELAKDLKLIRLKINRANYTEYRVDNDGPEFRFLTEMVEICGGECSGIYHARIMPLDNKMGFEAEIQCYQPGAHLVKYMWVTDDLYVDQNHCPR